MGTRRETENELWCGACREMHPKTEFGRDRNTPHGLSYACKAVVMERNRISHAKNRESNNQRHAFARRIRKLGPDRILWVVKKLASDASRRARKKGLEFDLDVCDLELPALCPVFGCELVYQANERRVPNSASLDRIESTRGYVNGNVWIISWRANQIKSDATTEELRILVDALEKKAAGRLLDGREWSGFPEGGVK